MRYVEAVGLAACQLVIGCTMTIVVSITVQLLDGHTSESDKGRVILPSAAWHSCFLSLEFEALCCSEVVVFFRHQTRGDFSRAS